MIEKFKNLSGFQKGAIIVLVVFIIFYEVSLLPQELPLYEKIKDAITIPLIMVTTLFVILLFNKATGSFFDLRFDLSKPKWFRVIIGIVVALLLFLRFFKHLF